MKRKRSLIFASALFWGLIAPSAFAQDEGSSEVVPTADEVSQPEELTAPEVPPVEVVEPQGEEISAESQDNPIEDSVSDELPTPETPQESAPELSMDEMLSSVIVSLQVNGNRRVESAAVLASAGLRVGEVIDPIQIRRDIKSIFDTGLFQDIRVDVNPADGGVEVTFLVLENPAIRRVTYSGQSNVSEDDITEVVDISSYTVFTDSTVTRNQRYIHELYVEKGYFLASVETVIHEVSDSLVDVEFVIDENRKVTIESVEITGNESIPDEDILKYMQTRPAGAIPWLTGAGTYQSENLENDTYLIRSVFLEEGFVDVEVEEPQVFLSPDKRSIAITIHVEEGLQYSLGEITASSAWLPEEGLTQENVMRLVAGESVSTVRAAMDGEDSGLGGLFDFSDGGPTLSGGDLFKLTDVQMIMQKISELYSTRGYAFTSVVPMTNTRPEDGLVDITFDIAPGEKFTVGRINITGNDPTWDKVIRREVPLNEGEIFDGSLIQESRERLQRLGFFEDIRISTPRVSGDNVLDVNIEVVEQPTGSFSVGAGFSSVENFVFTGNVSKNNFLGLGYVMSAAINWSGLRQQGNLSFADPHFLDSSWTLKVDAYSISQQYIEDQYTRGGGLAVGRYLDEREDWRLSLNYSLEDVGLTSITSYQERLFGGALYDSGLTSTMGLSLQVDKRNNRIMPTHGIYGSLSASLSGGLPLGDGEFAPFLGGEFNLFETKANIRLYQPIIPGSDALIFRLNSTIGAITSTDGRVVPYVHRYRAGGINSVRGFSWYSLGPSIRSLGSEDPSRADDRLVVGGSQTWINNFEIEAPILKSAGITGVVFFDAGNAFGDPLGEGNLSFSGLRLSYGAGIRWFSPIGPLRFELGYPVDPQEGEEPSVFDFSIGSFF